MPSLLKILKKFHKDLEKFDSTPLNNSDSESKESKDSLLKLQEIFQDYNNYMSDLTLAIAYSGKNMAAADLILPTLWRMLSIKETKEISQLVDRIDNTISSKEIPSYLFVSRVRYGLTTTRMAVEARQQVTEKENKEELEKDPMIGVAVKIGTSGKFNQLCEKRRKIGEKIQTLENTLKEEKKKENLTEESKLDEKQSILAKQRYLGQANEQMKAFDREPFSLENLDKLIVRLTQIRDDADRIPHTGYFSTSFIGRNVIKPKSATYNELNDLVDCYKALRSLLYPAEKTPSPASKL